MVGSAGLRRASTHPTTEQGLMQVCAKGLDIGCLLWHPLDGGLVKHYELSVSEFRPALSHRSQGRGNCSGKDLSMTG